MQKRKRTILGSPLTPEVLQDLNVLETIPAATPNFNPEKGWTHTYRIWRCHGYRQSGNRHTGFLKLTSRPIAGSSSQFQVEQQIITNENFLTKISATIQCRDDELSTPIRWELESDFFNRGGRQLKKLHQEESAEVGHREINFKKGHFRSTQSLGRRMTADWCLFPAVQRIQFDQFRPLQFDLLEGLSLLKENQQLSKKGESGITIQGKRVKLHGYKQIGRGILPYEYWLDETNRLVLVTTFSAAYILDPQAEEQTGRVLNSNRQMFRRRQLLQGEKS